MGREHVTQPIRGRCCLPGSAIGFVGVNETATSRNANSKRESSKSTGKTCGEDG